MSVVVTGDKAIDRKLKNVGEKTARKVTRRGVSKGTNVSTREIRKSAPVGKTKKVKKGVGQRNLKASEAGGNIEAKAGIGVGKKTKKTGKFAPHGHLVALGSKRRKNKKGANRGVMPRNDFVRRAFERTKSRSYDVMRQAIAEGIQKEAGK